MMICCKTCQTEKVSGDFYVSNHTQCKACVRQAVTERRMANLDVVRSYDRERAKLPHRRQNAKRVLRAWRRSNPLKVLAQTARYPDRYKAKNAANNAVRDGKLVKPDLCEGCGLPKKIEKHHPDYSRPLLVMWLCKVCHAIADKVRRKLESAA